jgi:hypothetical protein
MFIATDRYLSDKRVLFDHYWSHLEILHTPCSWEHLYGALFVMDSWIKRPLSIHEPEFLLVLIDAAAHHGIGVLEGHPVQASICLSTHFPTHRAVQDSIWRAPSTRNQETSFVIEDHREWLRVEKFRLEAMKYMEDLRADLQARVVKRSTKGCDRRAQNCRLRQYPRR